MILCSCEPSRWAGLELTLFVSSLALPLSMLGAHAQALGCLLYYLMFNKLAFGPEAKLQILNGDFTVAGSRPPAFVALLRELLVTNPIKRPGQPKPSPNTRRSHPTLNDVMATAPASCCACCCANSFLAECLAGHAWSCS